MYVHVFLETLLLVKNTLRRAWLLKKGLIQFALRPFLFDIQVMDLTMSVLVHPAKLISSMAPVLLEHVFTLRRVSGETAFKLPCACSVIFLRRAGEDQTRPVACHP